MSCSRVWCESIMCNTYITGVGYVCHECQQEFKDYLESSGKDELTKGEMLKELKEFIRTDKGTHVKGEKTSVEDFFKYYNN